MTDYFKNIENLTRFALQKRILKKRILSECQSGHYSVTVVFLGRDYSKPAQSKSDSSISSVNFNKMHDYTSVMSRNLSLIMVKSWYWTTKAVIIIFIAEIVEYL